MTNAACGGPAVAETPMVVASEGKGRLAALDLLRGIAIVLVLLRHSPIVGPEWLQRVMAPLARAGWIGVDLFFVLSGFLVSGLIFREYQLHGDFRPGRFLLRRGFKIYPAYFVLLLVIFALMTWRGNAPNLPLIASQVLFLQNYWQIAAPLPHTWSLAVEEHFYLVLPLLLPLLHRQKGSPFAGLTPICALVIAGVLAWRFATPWSGGLQYSIHFFPTHLRFDGLFFGVWLAWLHHFHGERLAAFVTRHRSGIGVAALLLALPPFFYQLETTRFLSTLGFTFLALSAGLWLLLALHGQIRRGVLAWIGFYSYSIYLWHVPVSLFGIRRLFPENSSTGLPILAYFAASIAVGVVAAKLIELPALRLRDRLFPSRSAR